MATRSFTLTATVPGDPEAAISFLLRLDAHGGMHPYLQSAEVVGSGAGPEGRWQDWMVVERPRLGPLRYTIRFPARMIRAADDRMVGIVRAAPLCRLRTTTRAVRAGGATIVTEETVVDAPAPVVGYMARHARLAHERTFSLLPAQLAPASSSVTGE